MYNDRKSTAIGPTVQFHVLSECICNQTCVHSSHSFTVNVPTLFSMEKTNVERLRVHYTVLTENKIDLVLVDILKEHSVVCLCFL